MVCFLLESIGEVEVYTSTEILFVLEPYSFDVNVIWSFVEASIVFCPVTDETPPSIVMRLPYIAELLYEDVSTDSTFGYSMELDVNLIALFSREAVISGTASCPDIS